jgi:hypothetical protein
MYALKLQSPESICKQRGLTEGSAAWNSCIAETTAENERITREFYEQLQPQSAPESSANTVIPANTVAPLENQDRTHAIYGLGDTGFVPPFMSRGFARKINRYKNQNDEQNNE